MSAEFSVYFGICIFQEWLYAEWVLQFLQQPLPQLCPPSIKSFLLFVVIVSYIIILFHRKVSLFYPPPDFDAKTNLTFAMFCIRRDKTEQ